MSAPRTHVPLAQLSALMAPGQPLPFRIVDDQGRLLLAAGQCVHDARQLGALLERGACVDAFEAEEVRRTRAAAANLPGRVPSARRLSWFDRHEQQLWALDALLRRLTAGEPALAPLLEGFADETIALIEKQFDAALFLAIRQDEHRFALYALSHALNAAAVALLTARQLAWPPADARCAVLAALTMNASIVNLQARMAEQADPPTRKQMEEIRAHPHRSAELLRACGVSDAKWLAAVEDHHERSGPSGYPRGTAEIGPVALVLRAADVFTAKVSPRALRAALPPQTAARQLFQEEQGGPVASALIKAVGVYPPGDFVRLKNGEAAIVVQRAAAGRAAVTVALLGAKGKPVAGAPRRDASQPEFAISGALAERAGLPRVLPEQIFGLLEP